LEFISGTQQYTGYFRDISTQYAMVGIQLPMRQDKNRPRNILSVRFLNDQEGAYISRNRGYLGYGFHTRVFSDFYLGGGLEIGSMGYVVEGTPSTGNASRYVIDGTAGLSFYNEHLTTGFSINQVFNNDVQPLNEVTRLYRHMNLFAGYNLILTENAELYPSVMVRFPYEVAYNYNLDVGLKTVIVKKILLGTSYRYKNGISFDVGVTNFEVLNGFLTLCLAYNSPFVSSAINVNIFEIHINYKYLTKKGSAARLPSIP
jgi:hypothetical protein